MVGQKCLRCHFETPGEARVCGRCGAPLAGPGISADPAVTTTLGYAAGSLSDGVLFAGRYLVIEELGKGGMGSVYRVLDTRVDEEVALKFLNPDVAADTKAIERFRSELRITRKIGHHNVCRTYDIGQEGRSFFITMEYIPGEDLAHIIKRLGQLPVEKAFDIARQICEGLAEVHGMGVVHRDLKPKNIMIDREGRAKIMDFGLARTPQGVRLTEVGHVIGTPGFMSPEQLDGETADARSDIFALGVTMYNMLTGALPFPADSTTALALQHRTLQPTGPQVLNPRVPEDLSRIVVKCLQVDKAARYASAQDLLVDLQKAGRRFETYDFSVRKKPMAAAGGFLRLPPVAKGLAAAALLLVLAASGLALRSLLKRPQPRLPPSPVVQAPAAVEPKPLPVEPVKVTLVTVPGRATLEIDGVSRGLSGGPFDLAPGTHTIKISKPGFREFKTTLAIEASGSRSLTKDYRLVPLPPATGTLEITSEPPEADVFVGSAEKASGKTPLTLDLPAGKVVLRFSLEGYQDLSQEAEIRAGNRSHVEGSLMPLPGTVELSSEPAGAEIYSGNERLGTTPLTRFMAPAVYRLRIVWPGAGELEDVITVQAGKTLIPPAYKLAVPEPATPRYYLKIYTNPPGAAVTINGALVKGLTPCTIEIEINEARIKIEKEGYKTYEGVIYGIRPFPGRNDQRFELEKVKDTDGPPASAR